MSTFAWIDHNEKQRRQILEAIDLFREKDTRDELGISIIRDAFADLMFPGTGSLQTRARYFFFVPWMYRRFEEKGLPAGGIGRAARDLEIKLIDTLADSPDTRGVIGKYARASLQRVPSSIYWNGLKTLRIGLCDGSQGDYHRSFERLVASRRKLVRNDDGEVVGGAASQTWAAVPPAPGDFPSKATFVMTSEEAVYLRERVLEHNPASLFSFLFQHPHKPFDAEFVWDHPVVQTAGGALQRQLEHARNFSEVMFGAAILYNLNLAEMEPVRKDVRQNCLEYLEGWRTMMANRREAHLRWDREDFWNLVREAGAVPTAPTRWFVDAWIDLVLVDNLSGIAADRRARDLIVTRERNIKGPLARCDNDRAREVWRGEAGLNRLDFRWTSARWILVDVLVGLGEHDA
ncbi:MAG TPA: DUF6361 family protein [Vicinamibacterales bacterium]|nr:DUF6361 family protein [Vicinamibacterales bacterium]